MLQQTQVETVIPRYTKFLSQFPTLAKLATAPEQAVLDAWAGLGYYRRAKALHQAAQLCVTRHGGSLPTCPQQLQALPGMGPYSVGAVGSIAFGLRLAAVDGNVKRFFARLFAIDQPLTETAGKAYVAQCAQVLVEQAGVDPGIWNQALMELGALVCRPRSPLCEECPLEAACMARRSGLVDALPVRAPRKRPRVVAVAAACIVEAGCALIVRRPAHGLLASMWGIPMVEGTKQLLSESLEVHVGKKLRDWQHVFTHRRWHAKLYACGAPHPLPPEARWVSEQELRRVAFPSAFKAPIEAIQARLSSAQG